MDAYEKQDDKKRVRPGAEKTLLATRARAHEIGKTNLEKLLLWVYRWGWTTEPVLQKLMGVVRRPGADYVRRGILQRVEAPRGHLMAYCLTSAYVGQALELYDAQMGLALPYPYPRTAIPFAALGEHNHQAQLIALEASCGMPGDVRCAREFDSAGALPDFTIEGSMGQEWHEVELTAKYRERLLFQLEERAKAFAAGQFASLTFWCRTGGIARNIEHALKLKQLPRVKRRADGRIAVRTDAKGWSPADLADVTKINVVGQPPGQIPVGGQRDWAEEERLQIIDEL